MKSVLYRNQGLEVLRNPLGFWSYIYLKTQRLLQVSLWSNVSFFSSSVPSFLSFNFYWSTADIPYCVSFLCASKWISYIYIHIYFKPTLFIFISHMRFTKYWVESWVLLQGRSLLFIYFIHSSVYVSVPISEPNVCFFGTYACVKLLGSERNRLNCGFFATLTLKSNYVKFEPYYLALIVRLICKEILREVKAWEIVINMWGYNNSSYFSDVLVKCKPFWIA